MGERGRPPVPALLAGVLSDAVDQPLTPSDLGLASVGPVLGRIQLPMLTGTDGSAEAEPGKGRCKNGLGSCLGRRERSVRGPQITWKISRTDSTDLLVRRA